MVRGEGEIGEAVEEKEEEKKKQWSANLDIGFSVQSTSSQGGK